MFKPPGRKVPQSEEFVFELEEVLIECDRPLLIVMKSSVGEKWLFNWCLSEEVNHKIIDRWMIYKASDTRIESLLNGNITLRESILLCENEFFLADFSSMESPDKIWKVYPDLISDEFLPEAGVTIYPTTDMFREQLDEQFTVQLHMLSASLSSGNITIPTVNPIEVLIQNMITWTAHKFVQEEQIECFLGADDWTHLSKGIAETGSYRISLHQDDIDSIQKEILYNTLKQIGVLTRLNRDEVSIQDIEEQMGISTILNFQLLLHHITKYDLSLSIRWIQDSKNIHVITINPNQAKRLFAKFNEYNKRDDETTKIRILLTPDEIELIQRPVRGRGGMQNLNRMLQQRLDGDVVELSPSECERVVRYCQKYGQGGFQTRFYGILKALKRMKLSVESIR